MSDDFLDIVLKYYNVAKTIYDRPVLVKNKTMLPFLAYCISSNETSLQVVEPAIDTLMLLAANDCNVGQLIKTYGLLQAVEFVSTRDDLSDQLKTKVLELHNRLICKDAPAFWTRSSSRYKAQDDVELKKQFKKTNLINLYVHGMNKESRQTVESAVITVKGVVSVVLDLDHQRCAVCTHETVTPLRIASAIFEKTGMEAKLILRNRIGQEVLKPILETSCNDSQDNWPPYLKEEDSPIKEKAVSHTFLIKDKTSYWINSAVGFFQKSFYW